MSLIKKVTHGVVWLALAQVARRLSGIIITAVLARLLAPEIFGLVAMATLTVQLLALFSEMGITSALVQREEVSESHLNSGFWLNVGTASALALLGVILAKPISLLFHEPRLVPLLMVMMVVLPLSALGQISDVLLQRTLAFKQIALIDWVASVVAGVLGVVVALAGWGLWALVVQSIVLAAISTVGRLRAARWMPSFIFDKGSVGDLFSFSVSVLGCAFVNYGATNIDNALIGGILGSKALGFYMLAYTLVMMPGASIGALVTRVMFPALSSMQSDLTRLRRAYLRMLRVTAIATFPFIIGMGVTAPLFINLIYGPHWAPSIVLLQILTVWGVFQAINLAGVVFYALAKPNILLYYAAFSLFVMTLSFVVGVRWGVEGVAWACAAVSPLVGFGPHIIANRLIAISTRKFIEVLAPPLVAALLMGVVVGSCVLRGQHLSLAPWVFLGLCIVLGIIIYSGILATWGLLSRCRRHELKGWLMGENLDLEENEIALHPHPVTEVTKVNSF